MSLARVFSVVGTTFGAIFVFVNAPALPYPWSWLVSAVGLVLVLLALVRTFRASTDHVFVGGQRSIRIYWLCVLAELVAIPAGAAVLNGVLHRGEFTVVWVVFVVGLHFLPARAFGDGRTTWLGLGLVALAVAGAVGTLAFGSVVASLTGVFAGFALLVSSALLWGNADRVQPESVSAQR